MKAVKYNEIIIVEFSVWGKDLENAKKIIDEDIESVGGKVTYEFKQTGLCFTFHVKTPLSCADRIYRTAKIFDYEYERSKHQLH